MSSSNKQYSLATLAVIGATLLIASCASNQPSCSSPQTRNLNAATKIVQSNLMSGCQAHFDSYYDDLLTIADGDVNLDGRVGRGDIVAILANFGAAAPTFDPGGGTGNDNSGIGDYWLADLPPGDHTIREIVPEDLVQTQPTT